MGGGEKEQGSRSLAYSSLAMMAQAASVRSALHRCSTVAQKRVRVQTKHAKESTYEEMSRLSEWGEHGRILAEVANVIACACGIGWPSKP